MVYELDHMGVEMPQGAERLLPQSEPSWIFSPFGPKGETDIVCCQMS